jgi:aryl-alcohol dehydrogenase-like predicted oxidoreductase
MNLRALGRSGLLIHPMVFGCAGLGVRTREDLRDAICAAWEAGVIAFDTAEVYGTEGLLADALGAEARSAVVLDKVAEKNLAPAALIAACERSLVALRRERVELYQVHWPSGATISGKRKGAVVPLEETLGALDSLRHRGLIGAIGLCNFSVDEVQAALRCTRVESLQCSYSLLWRQPQRGLLDLCAREGLAFLAYSPLAQGLVVRAPPGNLPPWDMRMRHRLARGSKLAAVREARLELEALAAEHGTSVAGLAIGWLSYQTGVFPVVGSGSAAHVHANARSAAEPPSAEVLAKADAMTARVAALVANEELQWSPLPGRARKLGWRVSRRLARLVGARR